MLIPPTLIVAAIVVFYLLSSIKIITEYERAVVFRLGKLLNRAKGPGVILVFKPIDRMVRVTLRTVVHDVPAQDVITRDNVSVKVNAVVYFRVVDPRRAIVEVENYQYATSQLSQTTLRSVLGQVELDDLLSQRDRLNQQLQHILDEATDGLSATSPRCAFTPRPTSTPKRKITADATVTTMNRKTICFPLNWISWNPSSAASCDSSGTSTPWPVP